MKALLRILLFTALATTGGAGLAQAESRSLKMITVTEDFLVKRWTLECPDGAELDLSQINLSDAGIQALTALINSIEAEAGVRISSRTVVTDRVTQEDRVRAVTRLTVAEVQQIKAIIDQHSLPDLPLPVFPRERPHLSTVTVDGALQSLVLHFGDGRVLDLLTLDPPILEALLGPIQQLEQSNGVHLAGSTTVQGGAAQDSLRTLLFLSPADIAQILAALQPFNLVVPPNLWRVPVAARVRFKMQGQRFVAQLRGSALLQLDPLNPFDFLIPELELEAQQATPFGPLFVDLPLPGQGLFVPHPPKPDAPPTIFDLQWHLPLMFRFPQLAQDFSPLCPVPFTAPVLPLPLPPRLRGFGPPGLAPMTPLPLPLPPNLPAPPDAFGMRAGLQLALPLQAVLVDPANPPGAAVPR